MSNKHWANTGDFQNEQRLKNGNNTNELRGNYGKMQNEPRGNSEGFQVEARAKQEIFQNELQANHWKMSNEQLVKLIRSGENEADYMLQLWQQNQRFIRMLAVKYTGYAELEDLQQEGYIGLHHAVQHYDDAKGVPFINYAAFWIKQTMQRYIENCGTVVRIPTHVHEWIQKYKKMTSEYRKYYGAEPSENVLCALLGVSREKLQAIKESVRMGQIRSMDEPLGDEDKGMTVGDTIESGKDMELDAVKRLDYQSMKDCLWEAVDSLPEGQAAVLRYRFIDNKTLKEVGKMDGVTIQAVRTQQDKAMRELRKPSRCQKFRGYYEEYIAAASVHHIGVESFRQNWWSEVERDAIGIW